MTAPITQQISRALPVSPDRTLVISMLSTIQGKFEARELALPTNPNTSTFTPVAGHTLVGR